MTLDYLMFMDYMGMVYSFEGDRQCMVAHGMVQLLEVWVSLGGHTYPTPREAGAACSEEAVAAWGIHGMAQACWCWCAG